MPQLSAPKHLAPPMKRGTPQIGYAALSVRRDFSTGGWPRMWAMLTRLAVKAAPITNRAAEYGPAVPVCCNVCRTCTTTNVVGLMLGTATAVAYAVGRFARRYLPGS